MSWSLAERKVICQQPTLFLPVGYGGVADGDYGSAEHDYRAVGDTLTRFSPFRSKTDKANVFGALLSNLISTNCYFIFNYVDTPEFRYWYDHYLCTLQYVAGDALPLTMKAWYWPNAATSPEWLMTIQETLPVGWTGVSELHLASYYMSGGGSTDSYNIRAKRTVTTYQEWFYSIFSAYVGGSKTVTNILQGRDHTPVYPPSKLIMRKHDDKIRMKFRLTFKYLVGGYGTTKGYVLLKDAEGNGCTGSGNFPGQQAIYDPEDPDYMTTGWYTVEVTPSQLPVTYETYYVAYHYIQSYLYAGPTGDFTVGAVDDSYPANAYITRFECVVDPDDQWYDLYAVVDDQKAVGTYLTFEENSTLPLGETTTHAITLTADDIGVEIPWSWTYSGRQVMNPYLITAATGMYAHAGTGNVSPYYCPTVHFEPAGGSDEVVVDWTLEGKPYPNYYTGEEVYNTIPDCDLYQAPVMVFEQVAETVTDGAVSATAHKVKAKTTASISTTQVLVRQSTDSTNRIHHISGTNNGYTTNYCLYSDDEGIHSFTMSYSAAVSNKKDLVPPSGYSFGDSVFCGKLYLNDLVTVYASCLMLMDVVKDGVRFWGKATSPTTPTVTVLEETHPKEGTLVSADSRTRCQGVWYEYDDAEEVMAKKQGIAFWGWQSIQKPNAIFFQEG